ncbi:MAG: formylglycine-generating enzyme family protein, partial [Cyanobacteria bacterium P01_D01_bin.36]
RKLLPIFKLPSEAQWEYACRAETTTPFYFGPTVMSELMNFREIPTYSKALRVTYRKAPSTTYRKAPKATYRQETIDVGTFHPNTFGLYDMHGNVWEWCLDGWHNTYADAPTDGSMWGSSDERKVMRGGSWRVNPAVCRAANRLRNSRDYRSYGLGFRVMMIAPKT